MKFSLLNTGLLIPFAAMLGGGLILATPSALQAIDVAERGKFLGDPIVFIHGCPIRELPNGSTHYSLSTRWKKIYNDFRSRGYAAPEWTDAAVIPTSTPEHPSSIPAPDSFLNVLVLPGHCPSNRVSAVVLAEYVQQVLAATGARKVDLVAHSMGGVATRVYMNFKGGDQYVRDIALLAAPNHGTNVGLATEAGLGPTTSPDYDSAREMAPAYSCDPLLDTLQRELNGCEGVDTLVNLVLGSAVEAEATPSYLNLYNNVVDEIVTPFQSQCLNQRFPNDCNDPVNVPLQNFEGRPHIDYKQNQAVIDAAFGHVSRRRDKNQP